MVDVDPCGTDRISGRRFGYDNTWRVCTVMRDPVLDDGMFSRQGSQTWTGHGEVPQPMNKKRHSEDLEPLDSVPAPSCLHATDLIRRFEPDPLLAVTPEKSLGLSKMSKTATADTNQSNSADQELDGRSDGYRKAKQRVRFAPDICTSPPSRTMSAENESNMHGSVDDDSVPRSYASLSEKLYQPGLYADSDSDGDFSYGEGELSGTKSAQLDKKASQPRYTVETCDNKTLYVPFPGYSFSAGSQKTDAGRKSSTAKIIKHRNTSSEAKLCEDWENLAPDTEIKEMFESAGQDGRIQRHDCGFSSTPPKHPKNATAGRNMSPKRGRNSPVGRGSSSSPARRSPHHSLDREQDRFPAVTIVREAPRQPSPQHYHFPFSAEDENGSEYDPDLEHPFARPEFNSALKISEDLKSVKERQPDTWGAVSKTLQTSNKKRTQIQEKASSRVNVEGKSGLFSGLVDIEVPLTDMCQNLEREKTLQAPSKPFPLKIPVGKEPDILEFYPSDLQHEVPDLGLTGIQSFTETLSTANPIFAFDLYRHNRAWDGVADS